MRPPLITLLSLILAACGGPDSRPWSPDLVPEVEPDPAPEPAPSPAPSDLRSEPSPEAPGEVEAPPIHAEPTEESRSATTSPVETPWGVMTLERGGSERCQLLTDTVVESHDGLRLWGLELGIGPAGGLLAWTRGDETLGLLRLDDSGQPAGFSRAESMPLARGLLKVVPVGERFLIMTQAICPEDEGRVAGARCLQARAFSAEGAPLGAATEGLDTHTGATIDQISVQGDEVYLAWSQLQKGHSLTGFRLTEAGPVEVELVDHIKSPVWERGGAVASRYCGVVGGRLIALEVNRAEQRWARLDADGAVELGGVPVVDSTPTSCAADQSGLSVIYTYRGHPKRRLARFDARGQLLGAPQFLELAEAAPPPFGGRLEVEVNTSRPRGAPSPWPVRVRRRLQATSFEVGQVIEVGSTRSPFQTAPAKASAWTGDNLVVTYSERVDEAWRIHLARIRCGPAAPPEEAE